MGIPEALFSSSLHSAITTIVLTAIGIISRLYLGPQDDWVEQYKRKWVTKLDPLFRAVWRSFLTEKSDEEYVCSTTIAPDAVEKALQRGGYVENDLSTVKYRILPNGERQYTVGQMKVSEPDSARQWHVYIFPGHGSYGTDCYQHGETDWNPTKGGSAEGHLGTDQISGDPESILRDALESEDVSYELGQQFKQDSE